MTEEKCPRCSGRMVGGIRALSRWDNQSDVCPDCGVKEGVLANNGIPIPPINVEITDQIASVVVEQVRRAHDDLY